MSDIDVAAFVAEIAKVADVKTPLQPHQQRVVDRIQQDDQPGLVVVHGLGSGKTLGALAAQDALGAAATYVVPAALRSNLEKEQAKHVTDPHPTDVVSMQNMAAKREPIHSPLMVVDEAHRARDPSSNTFKALARSDADKRLLLTGSPFYNHPSDISALVDLASGKQTLPLDPTAFSQRFIHEREVSPGFWGALRGVKPGVVPELNARRESELRKILGKWTDYHPGSTEGFPTVEHEDVKVPMSPEQLRIYDHLFDKAPPWVSYKVQAGLPPSKAEAKQLNAFLTGARQVSNSSAPFQQGGAGQEPKHDVAFKRLQSLLSNDPTAKAVIYSNFLEAGINPYKQRLDAAHIPYGEFTGEQPQGKRNDLVKPYNEGKLRTLLLSAAGGEGLDLKGTRLMQLLEPYWNQERGNQVEGRGARYMSHADLPEAQRNMKVERYQATRPASGVLERLGLRRPGMSTDEYLTQRSADKEKLISQFRALLPGAEDTPMTDEKAASYTDLSDFVDKVAQIKLSPRQLFIYVPLPEHIRSKLEAVGRGVLPEGVERREMDHCTLVYIAKADEDVPDSRIDKLLTALRETAASVASIQAKVQGLAYFDGAEDDGVSQTALVALLDAPGLEDLHVELKSACRRAGFEPSSTHSFVPHVTFAYLPKGERLKDLPLLDGAFEIDKVMFANQDKHEIPLRRNEESLGAKAAADVSTLQKAYRRLNPISLKGRNTSWVGPHINAPTNNVMTPPGGATRTLGIAGIERPVTGEGQKAMNILGGLHEGFERSSMARQPHAEPFHGHHSSRVLLDENNMLAALKGPGASDARQAFQGMRGVENEGGQIAEAVKQLSGGRFPFTYGETKLPKALKERLSAKLGTDLSVSSPEEKDAPAPDSRTKEVILNILKRVLGGAAGYVAPDLGTEAAGALMHFKEDSGRGHVRTDLKTREIARQMGASGFWGPSRTTFAGGGAGYMPSVTGGEGELYIPPGSPDATIAHEVGHKKIHEALGLPFSVASGVGRHSTALSPYMGAWAGAAPTPTNIPGYIQAALSLPMLVDEAAASAQAMYHMTKQHGLQGLLDSWHLIPAFGTYASQALMPLMIGQARKALADRQAATADASTQVPQQ